MSWVALGAAGIGLLGAAVSADSSRSAAKKQSNASQLQLDEQKRQFDLNRADQERWGMMQIAGEEEFDRRNRADKEMAYQRGATLNKGNVDRGEVAGNQLSYLMGLGDKGTGEKGWLSKQFTEADMTKDGGYNFRMGEGQKSVGNQFTASGNLLSGAAMKALTRFNQDFASNEYNNAYGRFNNDQTNQYNRLAGIQVAGQNAINSTNGLGGTIQGSAGNGASNMAALSTANNNAYGNAAAQNAANQGNINANLAMARGNSINQGLGSLSSAWNTYQSQQQQTPTWNNTTTPIYSGGWGTGNTYGNQDYGAYF